MPNHAMNGFAGVAVGNVEVADFEQPARNWGIVSSAVPAPAAPRNHRRFIMRATLANSRSVDERQKSGSRCSRSLSQRQITVTVFDASIAPSLIFAYSKIKRARFAAGMADTMLSLVLVTFGCPYGM